MEIKQYTDYESLECAFITQLARVYPRPNIDNVYEVAGDYRISEYELTMMLLDDPTLASIDDLRFAPSKTFCNDVFDIIGCAIHERLVKAGAKEYNLIP